ncbi:TPA: hypothetical protein ACNOH0_003786 [Enterobacter hormaechei]|uniref:hypothetical protein n=1 Tax=Enterobacter cloacae complex TaxID=354276 RepID=UPI00254DED60|nr:hypothetical protein [Enterobacter cloacae]MDK9968682.1 hypothetical protein [Enterobacter cloacae]MDK9973767.1 hypothetical protein [Enterobacter cloacae]MDL0011475.1 hypothetical protein [Enterobacter cloacae]
MELKNGFTLRRLLDQPEDYFDMIYVDGNEAYYSPDVYVSERLGREALNQVGFEDVKLQGWEPYTHTKEAENLWEAVDHKSS